jgi:hypothetical protein
MRDMQSRDENISSFRQEGPAVESNASDHLHTDKLTHIHIFYENFNIMNSRVQDTKKMTQIFPKQNRCGLFALPCFAKDKTNPETANLHMVFCASVYRVAWMQH